VSGAAVSGADALDGADALPGAGGLPGADTLAGAGGLAGVGVVFGSPRGGADILPGTRVLKVRTADPAAFIAVGGQTWGRVADGRVDLVPRPRPAPHSRPASWVPASSGGFSEDVDLIKVTPMTTAERLRRQLRGLAGVVIEGFGAGHVPRPHLEVLGGFAGPVVISTQVLTDAERLGTYASDRLLTGLPQVIEGGAMTSVAALVKLSWALAHNIDARKIMSTELAGEFGTPGFTVESAAGSHTIGWQED
jgi:L-asparaginase/Glu-tRNA(Gln) amidotransferase subunit D